MQYGEVFKVLIHKSNLQQYFLFLQSRWFGGTHSSEGIWFESNQSITNDDVRIHSLDELKYVILKWGKSRLGIVYHTYIKINLSFSWPNGGVEGGWVEMDVNTPLEVMFFLSGSYPLANSCARMW